MQKYEPTRGRAATCITTAGLAALILLSGCGTQSRAAASPSPSRTAASPSAAATPSEAASTASYAASLTFTGGISATVNRAQAPQGGASNSCGNGTVDVDIVIKGRVWSLQASADTYRGPGQYKVGSGFSVMIHAPDDDLWFSTGGTATYNDDKSLSVDLTVTNLMVPGGPGSTAHISGSFGCD